MSTPPYKTEFTLDKAYYAECFDQTADVTLQPKLFIKAALFAVFGLFFITLDASTLTPDATANTYYLGYFLIGLCVVELLSIKFKRTWWLWRQMMSKAAGNKVTITIDDDGIRTQSQYVEQTLPWDQVYRVTESEVGFTFQLKQSQSYLSKRGLSEQACDYIREKLA